MSRLNRTYTALCIVDPRINEEGMSKYQAGLSELVKKHGGKVLEVFSLGRRRLTYRIGKVTEGTYLQVRLELSPKEIAPFSLGVRLLEAHVRLLLVHASLEGVPHSTPETVTMQEE